MMKLVLITQLEIMGVIKFILKISKLYYLLSLFLLTTFLSCTINQTYNKLNEQKKRNIEIPKEQNWNKEDILEIYKLNSTVLNGILTNQDYEYFTLMEYATWCKPCIEHFDSNLLAVKSLKDTKVILYTSDDFLSYQKSKDYLKEKGVDFNTYMLDINEYGYSFSGHKRFENFYNQELYDTNLKNGIEMQMGLPKFITIDKMKNIINYQVGDFDANLLIDKLKLTKNKNNSE